MPTAEAFPETTTSVMALALSDSQSLPGHQATTSLPLDIPLDAAGQSRTRNAGGPAVKHIHLHFVGVALSPGRQSAIIRGLLSRGLQGMTPGA